MSRSLGNTLPAALMPLLDGRDLSSREGLTVLALTVGAEGWPYVAMLSVGEVLAAGDREIRLAMWPGSTSTANLTRTGQATLMLVHEGVGYYLRLSAQRLADLTIGGAPRAFFRATIEEVLEDVVAYATITSGLTFRLVDRAKVLPGWEETVRALRATSIPD
jgi:hypothetical protein